MTRKIPRVLIEVKGGVAYLVKKSKGCTVEIRDYDNYPNQREAIRHADEYGAMEEG